MAKQTRKPSPRLNVPPPGTLAYADGGAVRQETADELMARMTAKYGAPSAGKVQTEPVQPATQPQPKAQPAPQPQGIVGILKGRKEAIDKAVNGYSDGGKIKGPGTARSDSIPATIRETGEGIRVSNGERIVSKEQDAFLESVAKNAGYKTLDEMFSDAGLPVGPTIRSGKRAAADGMAPDDRDPFAYRGAPVSNPRVDAAIAAPPTLGGAPLARSEPAGVLTNPAGRGLTIEPFGLTSEKPRAGFEVDPAIAYKQPPASSRRDAILRPEINGVQWNGKGFDPTKEDVAPGAGAYSVTSGPNAGKNVALGPQTYTAPDGTPTSTHRGSQENLQGIADAEGIKKQLANMQRMRLESDAFDPSITDPNVRASARAALTSVDRREERQGLTEGRQLDNQIKTQRLSSASRLDALQADYVAEQDPDKREQLAEQIRVIKGYRPGNNGELTLPQQRSNAEIDAARARITGMTPQEIQRRTAKTTNTGRENPDFDPLLERAVTLANRRKVGADDHFDQRQQAQQPGGTDGDVATRFSSDATMRGYKLGKQTDQGHEVLDSTGRLVGHWN